MVVGKLCTVDVETIGVADVGPGGSCTTVELEIDDVTLVVVGMAVVSKSEVGAI